MNAQIKCNKCGSTCWARGWEESDTNAIGVCEDDPIEDGCEHIQAGSVLIWLAQVCGSIPVILTAFVIAIMCLAWPGIKDDIGSQLGVIGHGPLGVGQFKTELRQPNWSTFEHVPVGDPSPSKNVPSAFRGNRFGILECNRDGLWLPSRLWPNDILLLLGLGQFRKIESPCGSILPVSDIELRNSYIRRSSPVIDNELMRHIPSDRSIGYDGRQGWPSHAYEGTLGDDSGVAVLAGYVPQEGRKDGQSGSEDCHPWSRFVTESNIIKFSHSAFIGALFLFAACLFGAFWTSAMIGLERGKFHLLLISLVSLLTALWVTGQLHRLLQ